MSSEIERRPRFEIIAAQVYEPLQRLEEIMSTPNVEQPGSSGSPNRKPWLVAVAAAAVVIVAIGAVGLLTRDGGGDGGDTIAATPPLELNAGGEDVMASCIAFSVEYLAPMPVAFEGTVVSSVADSVTLDVDHWFKGGDASQVVLNAPQGMEALIGGFPFEEGTQYLITASEGNVNYCGFSGESTPEMRAAFEEAFGG